MNICINCKHYTGSGIWYNHFCLASERELIIDPVTGELLYKSSNDLEQKILTEQKYAFCKDINPKNMIAFYSRNR